MEWATTSWRKTKPITTTSATAAVNLKLDLILRVAFVIYRASTAFREASRSASLDEPDVPVSGNA
jgi:hypothetical protein